jgi:rsbT co-antagonist protein RsbR
MSIANPSTRQVVTEADLEARLAYFRITDEDLALLREMRSFAQEHTGAIVERFYEHLMSQPETRAFLDDRALVQRLKRTQTRYFLELFDGQIDLDYVERRLRIGAVHERLGVAPRWYIGAYGHYLSLVNERLQGVHHEPAEARRHIDIVEKVMHFDASLAMDAYIAAHLETVHRQQVAIRELSTPVIRVYDRVLMMPLVGTVDSLRAQQIMESVLLRLSEEQARVLILDIAGVAVVDTQVADYLLKTTAAVRLLGAKTILTGISPQVARTIVELGVNLSTLHTRNKLADGLALALDMVGKRITPTGNA